MAVSKNGQKTARLKSFNRSPVDIYRAIFNQQRLFKAVQSATPGMHPIIHDRI